jgi:hypothetical protein
VAKNGSSVTCSSHKSIQNGFATPFHHSGRVIKVQERKIKIQFASQA